MEPYLYLAEPEHYPELTEVWEASVRATHHFLTEADIQFYKPRILNEYLALLKVYYTQSHNRISGFIGISVTKVEMLFIHPDFCGQGLGKLLLTYAINEQGADMVDVNEQNKQAVGFYQHLGFELAGYSEVDGAGKPYPILSLKMP